MIIYVIDFTHTIFDPFRVICLHFENCKFVLAIFIFFNIILFFVVLYIQYSTSPWLFVYNEYKGTVLPNFWPLILCFSTIQCGPLIHNLKPFQIWLLICRGIRILSWSYSVVSCRGESIFFFKLEQILCRETLHKEILLRLLVSFKLNIISHKISWIPMVRALTWVGSAIGLNPLEWATPLRMLNRLTHCVGSPIALPFWKACSLRSSYVGKFRKISYSMEILSALKLSSAVS